jgi:hypothetical protein
MMDAATVAEVYREREKAAGDAMARMKDVTDGYNGALELALPELHKTEAPAAANLIYTHVNQTAFRIALPEPNVECRPLKSGIQRSEKNALDRKRVIAGWTELNDLAHVRLQRAMWLISYHSAPVALRPDAELGHPRWEHKDPRRFFPSDNRLRPENAVFSCTRTFGWLKSHFPEAIDRLNALYKGPSANSGWTDDQEVQCLEWWSADEVMYLALGATPSGSDYHQPQMAADQKACVCSSYKNLAGVCPVVAPSPVSLDPDDPRSQFDGMLGSYQMRSRLLALSYMAVFKGVFADEWAEPLQVGVEATVEQVPDPRQGIVGVVRDGRINRATTDPQFASGQMIDRLEYQERQTGSAPPEYGGSGATNVRTGRRGSQVMGAAIDYYIQAAQMRMAASYETEIDTAIRIDRAYFANVEKEMQVTLKGNAGTVKYRPRDLWETSKVRVRYPFAGSDLSNITLEAGQLVGLEAMDRTTLMELHPLIEDVEKVKDRITADRIDRAAFSALETQAADPAGPITMTDLAKFRTAVLSDKKEWWEAWGDIQAEKQAEQSAAAQGQIDPMAPEAMPGIDQAGMGQIAPPEETIPGLGELGNMLSKTRRPVMTVRGEAPAI